MKTKFREIFSVLAISAMVGTAALTGCKRDEVTPVPEETTDETIENVYYITGVVSTSKGSLSGATVTSGSESETTDTDGVYTLKMSSNSTASVNFSMDGYVAVDATAVFASDATAGASVTLSQQLTAQVAAKEAVAGEEATLTFVQESSSSDLDPDPDTGTVTESVVTIAIPAAAVTKTVEISATVYTPTATPAASVAIAEAVESTNETETITVTSPVASVNLQPSGTTFDEAITVSITSDKIEGAYHAKLVDGEWERQEGDLVYNDETGAYEIKLTSFSSHSITVDAEVEITSSSSSSSSTESLATEVFDNIGLVNAITESVSYDQKSGWELSSGASSAITSFAAGIMGSSAGISTIAKSFDVAVAGDEKVTVAVTQKIVSTKFTLGEESATAKSYGDVSVAIETEQGDMRTDHN